jgi:hypothetical protein
MQQILLNSCARAATAAEARYRIDRPIRPSRAARVVALDQGAEAVVRIVAELPWSSARFFTCRLPGEAAGEAGFADVLLRSVDGVESRLSDELTGTDVTVMVATEDTGAAAASAIGDACTLRGIMTAGLVLGHGGEARAAVAALRPYARVLMVTDDEADVSEVLTALRA